MGQRFSTCGADLSPGERRTLAAATTPAGWDALEPLARGRRTAVSLVHLDESPCVIKHYVDRRAFFLRTFLRASRAAREARAMELVAGAWSDNPVRAVAWGERRVLGFVPECWIVTTEFPGSVDLRQLKHMPPDDLAQTQALLLAQLPAAVAQLHRGGVFARTLRAKNVLLQPESGRIALIDLPYARRRARVSLKERAYDLASLWAEFRRSYTAEGWEAFLSAYRAAAEPDLAPGEAEQITAEEVQRVTLRLRHRTPFSFWIGWIKRRFRHSRVGESLTGFRYAEHDDGGRQDPERTLEDPERTLD